MYKKNEYFIWLIGLLSNYIACSLWLWKSYAWTFGKIAITKAIEKRKLMEMRCENF